MVTPLRDGDPSKIGAYRLCARLGGGGMGQVFLGRSPGGHTVAIKIVRSELADDSAFRHRFASEVEAARRVGGFYTAPVVDADPEGNPPWLATAYIPGPSLHTAVADHGPLPLVSVAVLGAGLAEGLTAVHACQVVHRDLKPANVLLAADGPRLIDFGIARALDTTSHTQTATVLGTAAFMSPEQAMGRQVGPASDVFSLGCVLAFAATGRSPFGEGAVHAVVYRVVHAAPDLTGLPGPLAGVVTACLTKTPEARPDLDQVLTELSALARSGPARPEGRWLPEAVTEVITRRTSTAATLVETTPESALAPVGAEKGPDRSAGSGVTSGEADLLVGNIGPEPIQVLVDGTAMGEVAPGHKKSFGLAPGSHAVQAWAAGRESTVWYVVLDAGVTTKLAFDIPGPSDPVPEPVQEATFAQSQEEKSFREIAAPIVAVAMFFGMLWVVGGMMALEEKGVLPRGVEPAALGLLVGIPFTAALIFLMIRLTPSKPLTLDFDGFVFPLLVGERRRLEWDDIEQISVIGDGPGAKIVLWYRKGHGPLWTRKKFQGGTAVCTARRVGVRSPRDLQRLRAALRWFAGDAYVEQSP